MQISGILNAYDYFCIGCVRNEYRAIVIRDNTGFIDLLDYKIHIDLMSVNMDKIKELNLIGVIRIDKSDDEERVL